MLLNCGVGENSWESLGLQGGPTSPCKGDQSWVFIGRTGIEAETPILWPPDVKSWLIGKDADDRKDWGQEEKGTTEDETVGWHPWLNGLGFGWTLGVGDGGRPGVLWFMGSQRVGYNWATELNWTVLHESLISSLFGDISLGQCLLSKKHRQNPFLFPRVKQKHVWPGLLTLPLSPLSAELFLILSSDLCISYDSRNSCKSDTWEAFLRLHM